MKPKTLILMVVAIVCGLGASYMTSRLLADKGNAKKEEVKVLVAKKTIDMGTTIKNPEMMFVFKPYSKGLEPKNAIVKHEELKDRMLKRPLREGDHITPDDLVAKNGGALAYRLPDGMRAVGIRINSENSASGFANLPMSRVDIIHTVRRNGDQESFSQVLLENVLVLAADTETKRNTEGQAMPAQVVTVALSPEDSLKVTMARELGTLSLSLRKFNDNTRLDNLRVSGAEVVKRGGGSSSRGKPEDEGTQVAAKPPVTAPITIPDLPTKIEAPKVVEDPNYKHVVVIIEGDRQRNQEYWLNKQNHKVANQDVVRSDPRFTPAPKQLEAPPQVPAVSPAPAVTAPPAPKTEAPVQDDEAEGN